MEKKKVLMLATTAAMIEQFNKDNIELLIGMGYDVYMAGNFRQGNPISSERLEAFKQWMEERNGKCFDISLVRDPKNFVSNGSAYKELLSLVKEYRFEFIHCHTPVGSVVGRMVAHKTKTPIIYTAHGLHFYTGAPFKNWLIYYPIEKFFSRWTDELILINQEDYDLALKKFHAKRVIHVNGVGVDTQKYNDTPSKREKLCKEISISEESYLILSVGELNKNKNHEAVIRGLAQYLEKHMNNPNRQDVHYLIAGIGALDEYLKELAVTLGLEHHVHFLGWRDDIAELCKSVDVFCFPSKREGLSLAVMEAMAAGLPIIASDIRGNNELVNEGLNGILCHRNNAKEYADAFETIQTMDQKRMSEQSRDIVRKYDRANVLEDMRQVYKRIIRRVATF